MSGDESTRAGCFSMWRICECLRNIWRAIINFFYRDQDATDSSLKGCYRGIFSVFRDSFRRSTRRTERIPIPRLELPAYNLHFEYNMSHRRRGVAMIFNHEVFLNPIKAKRLGTERDRDRLASVLECYNFDVKVFNDFSTCEIMEELKTVSKMDHTDSDCLLIVIMTHGEVGSISSYDGDYEIKAVTRLFRDKFCPTLIGKPRMFFIQACRGKELDNGYLIRNPIGNYDRSRGIRKTTTDVADITKFSESTTSIEIMSDSEEEEEEMVHNPPIYQDFLIVRSTMIDHLSFRNTTEGSWFIQDLCKELEVNGSEFDILNLLTHVNLSVSERESNSRYINKKKQILCITSRLTKMLRLNKRSEASEGSSTNL